MALLTLWKWPCTRVQKGSISTHSSSSIFLQRLLAWSLVSLSSLISENKWLSCISDSSITFGICGFCLCLQTSVLQIFSHWGCKKLFYDCPYHSGRWKKGINSKKLTASKQQSTVERPTKFKEWPEHFAVIYFSMPL